MDQSTDISFDAQDQFPVTATPDEFYDFDQLSRDNLPEDVEYLAWLECVAADVTADAKARSEADAEYAELMARSALLGRHMDELAASLKASIAESERQHEQLVAGILADQSRLTASYAEMGVTL